MVFSESIEPDSSYLQAPGIVTAPGPEYGIATRAFQGIPSIARGPNGRLWAVWYAGKTPAEDQNNYVLLATSEDDGETWKDNILVIDPDGEGPVRAFDPEIWLAPNGRLWLFWAQGLGHDKLHTRCGVWAMSAEPPASGAPRWSPPRRLCDGVMMCKPLVRSNAEWCLPVSLWHQRERGSAAMWVSTDQGHSWNQRGACDVPPDLRNHDEHMLVERLDQSLWMLVRTKCGIAQSVSADGGRNWSPLLPFGIPHPSSRFFIRRLASGRLLMVRHDPPEEDETDGNSKRPRSHLSAFLSEDDGHTWPHKMLLDERLHVSYPDGDQAPDGVIRVIYDYRRTVEREILMAVFREENILSGKTATPPPRLRVQVSKAIR